MTVPIVEGDNEMRSEQIRPFFKEHGLYIHYMLQYMNPLRALRIADRFSGLQSSRPMLPIELVFTTDVEYTPPWKGGAWVQENQKLDDGARTGLTFLLNMLKEYGIRGTFLLEGALAMHDTSVIQDILGANDHHEIGYHGWGHESYGGAWETNTKVQPEILTPKLVAERIMKGTWEIQRQVGRAPTSFVAPFHHARQSTIKALYSLGYTVDSSVYNHVYGLTRPFKLDVGIIELPFAVPFEPISRFGSPFYPTLLENIERHPDTFTGDIRLLSDALPESATSLTLLITCHPWEFVEAQGSKAVALRRLLSFIMETRNYTAVTMNEVRA